MTDTIPRRTGACLCGDVRYTVTGPMRQVVACHCSQCLRSHGHYAAYSAVHRDDIDIENADNIGWYQASDMARRGFCRTCGSRLFWDRIGADYVAVAAGTLDVPTGLHTAAHIFVADKPDYYEIDGNTKKLPQGFDGPAPGWEGPDEA